MLPLGCPYLVPLTGPRVDRNLAGWKTVALEWSFRRPSLGEWFTAILLIGIGEVGNWDPRKPLRSVFTRFDCLQLILLAE